MRGFSGESRLEHQWKRSGIRRRVTRTTRVTTPTSSPTVWSRLAYSPACSIPRLVGGALSLPVQHREGCITSTRSLHERPDLDFAPYRECQELVPCPSNDRSDYLTRSFDLLVAAVDKIAGRPAGSR
jgi:hypothetical protein